jgi:succinyl-diaminopimelate desuccinylase
MARRRSFGRANVGGTDITIESKQKVRQPAAGIVLPALTGRGGRGYMPGMDAATHLDPLPLARTLIRCPSVTPADAGALDVLQAALEALGFACRRMVFDAPGTPSIDNLYARIGSNAPNLCFAGHTDVVPVGDSKGWTVDPFGADVVGDTLYGRGATDMKGAIAAFVAATARFLEESGQSFNGSISLLITGDEEGPSINGTKKVLEQLQADGEIIDGCIVGEPTNPLRLGEMIKIGRRGSLNGRLTVTGIQGHVGYPDLADNPIPRLLRMLLALKEKPLDDGYPHFQASNLEITTVDVGNGATNVIPAQARAAFNVRFNPNWSAESLEAWLRGKLDAFDARYDLATESSAEPFLTAPGRLTEILAGAVRDVTGLEPELSTTGGTSDARFISRYCPVAEFGLIGQTMHKVDERARLADLTALRDIYHRCLQLYFAR